MLLSKNQIVQVLQSPEPLGNVFPVTPGHLMAAWWIVSKIKVKPVMDGTLIKSHWNSDYKPAVNKQIDELAKCAYLRREVIVELCRQLTASMCVSYRDDHFTVSIRDIGKSSKHLHPGFDTVITDDELNDICSIISTITYSDVTGDLFTAMTVGNVTAYIEGYRKAITEHRVLLDKDLNGRNRIINLVNQFMSMSTCCIETQFRGKAVGEGLDWINVMFLTNAVDHEELIKTVLCRYHKMVNPPLNPNQNPTPQSIELMCTY